MTEPQTLPQPQRESLLFSLAAARELSILSTVRISGHIFNHMIRQDEESNLTVDQLKRVWQDLLNGVQADPHGKVQDHC
jgi:hypothetical protein